MMMMKLVLCYLLAAVGATGAVSTPRWLEQNGGNDLSFLADYSVKYQGCAVESEWENGAITMKHLVHYSLCEEGCDCSSGGSGEYVVSLNTFTQAALGHICNNCGECNNDGGCEDQDCAMDDDSMLAFCQIDYADFLGCQPFGNNGRRFLEDQQNSYASAYCDVETSTIQVGVFSDDACTTLTSTDLGYAMPDLGQQCFACNDDLCETVYPASGKCESNMNIDSPSDNACTYISGLFQTQRSGSKTGAFVFVTLALLAVAAAAYFFYVRRRRAKITLEASGDGLIA
jgi:hypothetical protein